MRGSDRTSGRKPLVVGGDQTCVRSLRHALGLPHPGLQRGRRFRSDGPVHADTPPRIVVLGVGQAPPAPWPGGCLVWLLPERGPSEPDIAEFLGALNALPQDVEVRIVLCVPASVDSSQAADDVQTVGRGLDWVVPDGRAVVIEAVWLWGGGEVSLSRWLAGLP
jgi:hypothetical protein